MTKTALKRWKQRRASRYGAVNGEEKEIEVEEEVER